jgi:Chaperone of endosialidase
LGTINSSRRFKHNIKPMDSASESILAFKPVTFCYKNDKSDTSQFGLIAEEVAEINPELVVRDEKGEIFTVRYDAVNAMLLNEFLKEHKKVQELQTAFEAIKEQLKAQDEKIQKVTTQIETVATKSQMALND